MEQFYSMPAEFFFVLKKYAQRVFLGALEKLIA